MLLINQLKILIILLALALTSCTNSGTYVETHINIPNQPSNITNAGNIISLPDDELKVTDKDRIEKLILNLRQSELRNARAVNSCKAYHNHLQTIYKGKKQTQYMKAPVTSTLGGL